MKNNLITLRNIRMAAKNQITLTLPEGVDINAMMKEFAKMGIKTGGANKAPSKKEYDDEIVDTYIDVEVSAITNHRINRKGEYEFRISWKGYRGEKEWVKDSNCSCEKTIAKYLHTRGISTAYMICRVSTPEQALDNTYSLASQQSALESSTASFQRKKILRITGSAYKKLPKAITTVFEAARRGDQISVFRVDRLSRNMMELIPLLNQCEERGVVVYSVEDKIVYSEDKTRFLQLVLEAQQESDKMRKRQLQRLEYCRANKIPAGRLKYGKKAVNGVVVDDVDAKLCIEFIKSNWRSATDVSIANMLNEQNMLYKGRPWTWKTVTYIHKTNK